MRREPLLAGPVRRSGASDGGALILTLVTVSACLILYLGYTGRTSRGEIFPSATASLRASATRAGAMQAVPARTATQPEGVTETAVVKEVADLAAASSARPLPSGDVVLAEAASANAVAAAQAAATGQAAGQEAGAGQATSQAAGQVAAASQATGQVAAASQATGQVAVGQAGAVAGQAASAQPGSAGPPPHSADAGAAPGSLYDLAPIPDARGGLFDLSTLRGRVTLVVNTASACGYTEANFRGLQRLHAAYAARGLTVLAFPCDAFGGQEPHDAAGAADFARRTFNVTFNVMAKVEVDGPHASPVFRFLRTSPAAAGSLGVATAARPAAWNFEKVLVNRAGVPVARFGSAFDEAALEAAVQRELGAT